MKKNKKAILFDCANTLMYIKPSYPAAFAKVANDHGYPITEDAVAKILPQVDTFIREQTLMRSDYSTSPEKSFNQWVEINKMTFRLAGVNDTNGKLEALAIDMEQRFDEGHISEAFDDALMVLEESKRRGYTVGIISNATVGMINSIEKLQFSQYLDFALISAEVGWEKPGKEIFELALQKVNAAPDEILFVGDNVIDDIMGARNAGIPHILLNRNCTVSADNVACYVIRSLYEIFDILN